MTAILLFRATTRFFTTIGFGLGMLLLAPSPVQGQASFGFEVGAGPDLSLNRETFNDPSNDLVSSDNMVGYHYYLEAMVSISKRVSGAIGYSSSLIYIGNQGTATGYEIEAIYLRPTYHFIFSNRFSLGLSIMIGLRYHNYTPEPSNGYVAGGMNGQITYERESSFRLLIKRHEKALLLGTQAAINYTFPNGRSSLSLSLGATSSMKKLMEGYIRVNDMAQGTDEVNIGNWGEMVYFTLGYRVTFPLRKGSN